MVLDLFATSKKETQRWEEVQSLLKGLREQGKRTCSSKLVRGKNSKVSEKFYNAELGELVA